MNIEKSIPIATDRLLLDRFTVEDWTNLYKIEKSREQHRFNFETYNPRTEEQIKDYVVNLSKQNYNECILPFLFAIRLKEGKQLIGFIGFKKGKLIEKGVTEVYYSIYKEFWNNGFGTEALKGMLRFGFDSLKLHRIFAGCDIDNVASKQILEKSGMQFESRWRKDRIRNGKWKDGLGFAILEKDCV
jgi:RimJ/RimL family protein N-acetyltransferase